MKDFNYIIYTDGSGKSSMFGGKLTAIVTKDGKTPLEVMYRECTKELTCNEAEYLSVVLALEEQLSHSKILIRSDSQLVVNQMHREKPWKINFDHLRELNSSVRNIISNLELDVEFEFIPRDHNLAGLFLEGKLKVPQDIITLEH